MKKEQTMGNSIKKKYEELAHDVYEKLSIVKDAQNNKNDATKLSTLQSYLHDAIKKLNNVGRITINLLDAFTTPFSSSSSYSDNDDDGSIHHLSKPIKILIKFSMVPIVILCGLLMAGMSFVWMGDSIKCVQRGLTYGILPMFVVVVLIGGAVILTMICVWSFWMNDLCSGAFSDEIDTKSSGSSFSHVFFETESNEDRFLSNNMYYYELDCTKDSNGSSYNFLNNFDAVLNDARSSVKVFCDFITSSRIKEVCSECSTDFEQLQNMTKTLQMKMQVLQGNVILISHLLDCEKIQYLYIETLNSPACRQTNIGLGWVVVSLTIMIFCGMIVVTLRSAWLDDEVISQGESAQHSCDEDQDYQQLPRSSPSSKSELNGNEENTQQCDAKGSLSRLDVEKMNADVADETVAILTHTLT
uniref:Uncharacterized protein n=1 Tax=Helicotheca tamesis TaxID=374047 RepID=A0A7S2HDR0_9STRA